MWTGATTLVAAALFVVLRTPAVQQQLIALTTTAAEVLGSLQVQHDGPHESESVVVSVDTVNIRNGPGRDFAIIGQATRDASFAFTGRDGQWYQISYGNQPGWIHEATVQVDAP